MTLKNGILAGEPSFDERHRIRIGAECFAKCDIDAGNKLASIVLTLKDGRTALLNGLEKEGALELKQAIDEAIAMQG